jgi:LemA protein
LAIGLKLGSSGINDLIPNIVETVKGYAKHEKDTLDAVIEARSKAVSATTKDDEIKASGSAKSVKIAKGIFWLNFAVLSALMGLITPYFINKLIKKDVADDTKISK